MRGLFGFGLAGRDSMDNSQGATVPLKGEDQLRQMALDWHRRRGKPSPMDPDDLIEFARAVAAVVTREQADKDAQIAERFYDPNCFDFTQMKLEIAASIRSAADR